MYGALSQQSQKKVIVSPFPNTYQNAYFSMCDVDHIRLRQRKTMPLPPHRLIEPPTECPKRQYMAKLSGRMAIRSGRATISPVPPLKLRKGGPKDLTSQCGPSERTRSKCPAGAEVRYTHTIDDLYPSAACMNYALQRDLAPGRSSAHTRELLQR